MRIKLISCGICEHWHSPHAHHNHCPACGSFVVTLNGRRRYYNVQSAREMIKSGWPVVIKRLIQTAMQGVSE